MAYRPEQLDVKRSTMNSWSEGWGHAGHDKALQWLGWPMTLPNNEYLQLV